MSRIARLLRDNALGVIAITIALSAGAYAATDKAPKDSVVSSSIKNGHVKGVDLRDRAVDGSKVEDNSLTGADVNESSLDLTGAHLGPVQTYELAAGSLATGICDSPTIYIPGGVGQEGDFLLVTTMPAMPSGVVTSAQLGPPVAGTTLRQYRLSVCNVRGSAVATPAATLKMLVIHQ